jgi:putative ABC transport system ATP-binding protein
VSDGAILLSLRGASRTYRRGNEQVRAVRNADLELVRGELVVVRGPSGSGKTTLLNLVLGWEHADEGTLERHPDLVRSPAGVVPQRLGLLEHLTIAENASLPLRAARSARGERLDPRSVLRRLDLDHVANRFPPETSLGEQQRAACARAVVARRPLLVADEPTSHQDGVRAALVVDELGAAAADGAAVLVATHDDRVAERADRCFTIVDGSLCAEG